MPTFLTQRCIAFGDASKGHAEWSKTLTLRLILLAANVDGDVAAEFEIQFANAVNLADINSGDFVV